MNRTFLAPFALSLFLLSGCSGLGTIAEVAGGTISSVAPDTINIAKQALTAAHDAHASTARLLTIAAQTNLCHAACAATAKVWLDQSEAALVAGDKLIALGDAPGIEAKITSASALLASVQALIGKK